MADYDDKSRTGAREHARLRATLGEEPGSGYAYHDEGRVERVRLSPPPPAARAPSQPRSQPSQRPPEPARPAAKPRSFANTLVGGITAAEALAQHTARRERETEPQPVAEARLSQAPRSAMVTQRSNAPSRTLPPPAATPMDASLRAESQVQTSPIFPPDAHGSAGVWNALPSLSEASPAAAPIDTQIMRRSVRPSAAPPASAPALAPQDQSNTPSLRPARLTPTAGAAPQPGHSQQSGVQRAVPGAAAARALDPRMARVEPLVARNAWDQVLAELSRETELPAPLALLKVIARREVELKADAGAAQAMSSEATSAVAMLLGVYPHSPAALVVAKRLLRRNPRGLVERPPSASISTVLIVLGLALGIGLGWLLTRTFL